MTGEANEWAARISAVEAAQSKLDAATKLFEAGKQKLMDEYKDEVASAKKKLDNLLEPAFPEEIIPVWNGNSPTAAASSFVLEIGKNSASVSTWRVFDLPRTTGVVSIMI